jgi:hypothetical protein
MAKKRSSSTTSVPLVLMFSAGLALFVGTQSSLAGDTVRDHRGANGAPQGGVTVNGQAVTVTPAPKLGGPKYKGGYYGLTGTDYGKGKPTTGVTVRDHR